MTILEIMERANSRDTNLVIGYVKDAIMYMQSTTDVAVKVDKQAITKNVRDYSLPSNLISLHSVSVLDTEDGDKYKKIRRLHKEPVVSEDLSP